MSDSRETILSTLQKYLWGITWKTAPPALVTRNMRWAVDVEKLPAVFILSFPDEVLVQPNRGKGVPQTRTRNWEIGVASFIEGSTPELAPTEIESFQELVMAAVNSAAEELKCQILETQADHVLFPEDENTTIGQALWFRITYTETVN